MKASEFDELLRSGFGQHEFAFNPDNWARMNNRLELPPPASVKPARRRSTWLAWGSGIAATLVAAACVTWLAMPGAQPGATSVSAVQPAPARMLLLLPPAARQAGAETYLHAIQPVSARARSGQQRASTLPVQQTSAENKNKGIANIHPVPQQIPGPSNNTRDASSTPINKKAAQKTTGRQHINLATSFGSHYTEDVPQRRGTSFSLGGGVNYGSMNTGYAVAVNARHNLGRNLFLEGDLGIVNNTASNAAAISEGTYSNLEKNDFNPSTLSPNGGPDMIGSQQPAIERRSINFYYVQFAPTIGYQVSRKFSIGAGPDFQQLLQSQGDKNVVTSGDNQSAEVIRDFDFGVQGKTEYSVTSRLKAGLQYREGLNQLFQKGNERFVNRRYMQVQLKYTLFGK